ncbi:MAG TPA: hypothetical protein VI072_10220 [Polyangiaceae bacterium]
MRWSATLSWLGAALAIGCSKLPDSAAPSGELIDPSEAALEDGIRYRALTRADFKGEKPPGPFAQVADRVGAATCGQVLTTPDMRMLIHWEKSADGDASYRLRAKRLRFQALMDRQCSWWNDKVAAFAPAYVLEHEQIHFALYELGARRLNEKAAGIMRDMESEGSTREQVEKHAEEVLTEALQEAVEDIVDRNREFDEDTSLGYKPTRQKAWLERVNGELRATQRWARSAVSSTRSL